MAGGYKAIESLRLERATATGAPRSAPITRPMKRVLALPSNWTRETSSAKKLLSNKKRMG